MNNGNQHNFYANSLEQPREKTYNPTLKNTVKHQKRWQLSYYPFGVNTQFATKTTSDQHFSIDKYETFLPVIVTVVLQINTIEHMRFPTIWFVRPEKP